MAFVFWNQPPVATIHEPGHSFARHRMKSADQSAALVLSLAFWTVPIFVYLCQVIRPNSYGLHIVTYWVKYCSVTLCFSSTFWLHLVTSMLIDLPMAPMIPIAARSKHYSWSSILQRKSLYNYVYIYIYCWWFQPLCKIFVSWYYFSQYMEKSNAPNQQPDIVYR